MNKILKFLKDLKGFARINEYWAPTVLLTILGYFGSGNDFGDSNLINIFLANFSSLAFAFMINDVEDREDDAADSYKHERNPVSNGAFAPSHGYLIAFTVGVISIILYATCGLLPFIIGLISLTLGILYSWKKIRLKSLPIIDAVSHGLFLSTLPFLAAYFSNSGFQSVYSLDISALWFSIGTFLISTFGCLHNQYRDFEVDRKANLNNTAKYLGKKTTGTVMWIFFTIGLLFIVPGFLALTNFHQILFSIILATITFFLTEICRVIAGISWRRNLDKGIINMTHFFALAAIYYVLLNDSILRFILGY